ncbi:MAG: hypothetical protein H0T51_14830 [Pirellulales bacterium]|nr:hypothetical protein [Pirellulales bacterium]
MSSIQPRTARGLEIKLCRMLLGNEASMHPDYHLFVATDAADMPLGVGSLRSGAESLDELWGVHVAACPISDQAADDLSTPRALIAYARSLAMSQGARVLQTLRWFEQDSADHAYWATLGFTPHQYRYTHEISARRGYERLSPLVEQIHDHDWAPVTARIIPLADADVQAVCDLHIQHLGGSARRLMPMLDGSAPHAYDRRVSMVLLCGEQTKGFTLGWFPEPSVCEIAANVLDPTVRLGWADLLLKHAAVKAVLERGGQLFRFCTAEQHRDSRRTLERVGGGVSRTEVRMQTVCQLTEAQGAASDLVR